MIFFRIFWNKNLWIQFFFWRTELHGARAPFGLSGFYPSYLYLPLQFLSSEGSNMWSTLFDGSSARNVTAQWKSPLGSSRFCRKPDWLLPIYSLIWNVEDDFVLQEIFFGVDIFLFVDSRIHPAWTLRFVNKYKSIRTFSSKD